MVVPVPWTFALSLKFETRICPGDSKPPRGKRAGTTAIPYGFTSPLAGTVVMLELGVAGRLVTIG